ncbi:MAG: hypothetical protein HYR49_00195 [Gammaproteobacteria bacterium]|nr:hypothetical protein [Gammaproteobacteria bacterium]
MKFDIGVWWHWLFIAFATLGSAYNACRVFVDEFATSHNPLFTPMFQFFYELAGSFAGWMSLWYVLPLVFDCKGGNCTFSFSWFGALLLAVAVVGIFGHIPGAINKLVDGIGRLVSGSL